MSFDPATVLRHVARGVRHHPALKGLNPIWKALRRPYLAALGLMSGRQGIGVLIAGIEIRLDHAFATQNWEEVEAESYGAYVRSLREGMVVFDIGAHIGTYTLLALNRVGTQGKVVAYEPHPPTRQFLLRHLEMNGCANRAVVRDVCCGSREGSAPFYFLADRTEGVSGLVPVEGFQRRDVAVTTVDAEVGALGLRPGVLKIDVEGAEFDVLRGAEETLRTVRPTIFLSIHPEALAKLGHSEEMLIDWLRARGYRCDVLARDHEVHVRASAPDRNARPAA